MAVHGDRIIGSFFEIVFTAIGLIFELAAGFFAWLFRPAIRAMRTALGADRPKAAPTRIETRELPQGAMNAILQALRAGKEAAAALPPGWRGFHSAISSDSEKIGHVTIGTGVRLILEPDNADREDAVRVDVELPDRSTVQIGYLRRGHELSRSIAHGRVHGWFATRRRTLRAEGWEAVLFVAVYDP